MDEGVDTNAYTHTRLIVLVLDLFGEEANEIQVKQKLISEFDGVARGYNGLDCPVQQDKNVGVVLEVAVVYHHVVEYLARVDLLEDEGLV